MLAAAGVASRRAAEQLIVEGRVTVDGRVADVLGTRVDPARARIEVDGERINVSDRHRYILVNKPEGVVTTASDEKGRKTVLDLVRVKGRVYPVGRLDADTAGLILLTDHGELAHRLTHPRYQVRRVYIAQVAGVPNPTALRRLRDGIELEDGFAKPRSVRVFGKTSRRAQIEIVITEGRKHEVRRLFDAIGHPVERLVRIAFGPLALGELAPGKSRHLEPKEVGALLAAAGL